MMATFETFSTVNVADVVQIDPEKLPLFGGCFAIVEEVRAWGVVAYVPVPDKQPGTIAPVRLEWTHFAPIGASKWGILEEGDGDG